LAKRKKIHAAWIWIFSLSTGCLAIALILGSTCRDSFHKGFVLSLFGETEDYTCMDAIRDLVDLGASHVSFMILHYQEDEFSSQQFPADDVALPEQRIRQLIQTAKECGLRVLIMPTIFLRNPGEGAWRGTIQPEDPEAWMDSYRRRCLGYAKLAQEEHADYFCIGSELTSMEQYTGFWRDLIQRTRAVFSGRLLYSANWNGLDGIGFWEDLDYAGLNGYFNLNPKKRPDTDLETVSGVWRWNIPRLSEWQKKTGKKLIFTEVGYRSVRGALQQPWNYHLKGEAAPEEQARGYRAFIGAWDGIDFLRGVYFYDWSGAGGLQDTDYTPRGKPAENIVREWFKTRSGRIPITVLDF